MKICKYCGIEKDELQFEVAATRNNVVYRRLKCKTCKQQTQNNRRSKNVEWLKEFKKTLKCEHCNLQDYRVLDFHHLDSSTKDTEVANLLNHSIKRINTEIAKCIVLCANCHRIEHYNQRELV